MRNVLLVGAIVGTFVVGGGPACDDGGEVCVADCMGRECGLEPNCGREMCGYCPAERPTCDTLSGRCVAGATWCGDYVCNGGETCGSCPADCGACPATCGDGVCSGAENETNCVNDCCPADRRCATACCATNAACFDDGLGNLSCRLRCTSSNQCPAPDSCCVLLVNGEGVCVAWMSGYQCRCTTGVECTSTACAPATDASGNPVGPYVCKANDGGAYNGCMGWTTCDGAYCCVAAAGDNRFCSLQCTNDSNCGAAHCQYFDFSHTTCDGPKACGPF